MKKNKLKIIMKGVALSIFVLVLNLNFVLAQDNALKSSQNFKETANNLTNNVLTSAATLLMTAAFVMFFYGVVVFIYGRVSNKGDLGEIKKGKDFMLWGLAALFVMVSVWGIIKLAQGVLNIKGNDIQIRPVQFAQLDTSGTGDGDANPLAKDAPKSPDQSGGDFKAPPIQKDASGVSRENPFNDPRLYPVIKIGSTNLSAAASPDGKAFTLLVSLLRKKSCTKATYNNKNITMASGGFGTTYDAEDASFVKQFQTINGLKIDGTVGRDTWEALSVSTGQKTTFTGITVKDCW